MTASPATFVIAKNHGCLTAAVVTLAEAAQEIVTVMKLLEGKREEGHNDETTPTVSVL